MSLQPVHRRHLNLTIKHILKVSKTTYFSLYKFLHGNVFEILLVAVDLYDCINRKPPLVLDSFSTCFKWHYDIIKIAILQLFCNYFAITLYEEILKI